MTSPVIETGNDLDFDYAILDPISMRSIVQAAGRVRRHRPGAWQEANVLLLGRSPIAIQIGKLAMPGVETDVHHETGVSRGNLDRFPERTFRDLAGDLLFDKINAAPILSDAEACPLRDEEELLRRSMLRLSGEAPPLGRYLERTVARMNARFTRTRMFRRSTTRTLRYALSGDGLDNAVWVVDVSGGSGQPNWRVAPPSEFHMLPTPLQTEEEGYLFADILQRAWWDYAPGFEPMTDTELKKLVATDVASYSSRETILPVMTYGEQTGFTRNTPDDLFSSFGSYKKNQ